MYLYLFNNILLAERDPFLRFILRRLLPIELLRFGLDLDLIAGVLTVNELSFQLLLLREVFFLGHSFCMLNYSVIFVAMPQRRLLNQLEKARVLRNTDRYDVVFIIDLRQQ